MSQFCTRFVTCHCTFKLPRETLRKRYRNRATRRQEPAHAALWAPGEPCYTPRPALCRVASLRACCPTCAAKTSSYAQNLRSGGDFSQPGQAIDLLLLDGANQLRWRFSLTIFLCIYSVSEIAIRQRNGFAPPQPAWTISSSERSERLAVGAGRCMGGGSRACGSIGAHRGPI